MQGQRRVTRAATEPRIGPSSGGRTEGFDLNRERLVYCVTSLVGHRVTAKLRNNVVYEGLFHSCSLDGDYSITLKFAHRLPSDSANRSGEVVQTLVIPGKDYLQVSAVNLPPPTAPSGEDSLHASKAFATDGEITTFRKGEGVGDRELVPWSGGDGSAATATGGLEDGSASDPQWDQFKANEQLYGVASTYDEELYTTKLNRDAIPREQRERAERIAREIESGQMASEIEGRIEGEEENEEARFSAVQSGGGAQGAAAHGRKEQRGADAPAVAAAASPVPVLPQGRDLREHDALSGLTRDLRNRRGMISEMKRINALNLEPTLPKPDDGTRNARINYTESQARNASRLTQGSSDLKTEFQQSLAVIQKQEESKQRKLQESKQRQAAGNANADFQGASPVPAGQTGPQGQPDGTWVGPQGFMMYPRKPDGSPQGGYPQGPGDQARPKQFSFNPQAKAFSLNPQAGEFTPSGGGSGGGGGGGGQPMQAAVKPAGAPLQFSISKKNPDLLRKELGQILEPFFQRAKSSAPDSGAPDWPDAKGSSYHEVLGQPNPARPALVGAVPGAGGPVPAGAWQQGPPAPDQAPPMSAMGPGGGAPQMMQSGFVVANAPPGGPPAQMYQQMYPAPGGGAPGPQGPQGGMPPQGQTQQVVFAQQTMMAQQPGQAMAMPVGGMGPVPKFGGQQQQMVVMPVIMAPGQYQQGFVPQQGVQQPGQQGPPGPPGPPGPQAGGDQQGQMMQQPMYHRQSGAG
mmetsp:Transcript_45068/g.143573  ORF Transcript_45068/g.143573 Transcript_45068/m.143573 type:complete len:745 (+) Transcript_45068:67-2301(+)